MHAKDLNLLARILPHMAARWRLPRDLETLAALPDGRISIDVLSGAGRHAGAGPVELALARELKAGLEDQLARKGIPAAHLLEATVTLDTDTTRVKTDRNRIVHFDFRIAARIRTEAGTFEGSQDEEHVWHVRESGNEGEKDGDAASRMG
ncbi:MAG TPA: hypothetical protein VJ385_07975 [Fibrobacteria bacterium]|nr:hypothetical protein [Fibrobacteria bacterium]